VLVHDGKDSIELRASRLEPGLGRPFRVNRRPFVLLRRRLGPPLPERADPTPADSPVFARLTKTSERTYPGTPREARPAGNGSPSDLAYPFRGRVFDR
jgi:hypothetical protein